MQIFSHKKWRIDQTITEEPDPVADLGAGEGADASSLWDSTP